MFQDEPAEGANIGYDHLQGLLDVQDRQGGLPALLRLPPAAKQGRQLCYQLLWAQQVKWSEVLCSRQGSYKPIDEYTKDVLQQMFIIVHYY